MRHQNVVAGHQVRTGGRVGRSTRSPGRICLLRKSVKQKRRPLLQRSLQRAKGIERSCADSRKAKNGRETVDFTVNRLQNCDKIRFAMCHRNINSKLTRTTGHSTLEPLLLVRNSFESGLAAYLTPA